MAHSLLSLALISLLSVVTGNSTLTSSPLVFLPSPPKGHFLPLLLPLSSGLLSTTTTTSTTPNSILITTTDKEYLTTLISSNSTTNQLTSPSSTSQTQNSTQTPTTSSLPPSTSTLETLPQPQPQTKAQRKLFKWNSVSSGQQNELSYKLNCTADYMTIEVNVTGVTSPYVYLEKLKTFSICRPKLLKGIATFHLALDDNFYRCGTTKVHDQRSGTRVYYNRVLVESKMKGGDEVGVRSVYFKCSLPSTSRIFEAAGLNPKLRSKRQLRGSPSLPVNHQFYPHDSHPQPRHPHGPGELVNFTEIDLPDNFMEAEILDFDGNITARAPYPHLNLKVKRNGQLVNTSLNVAPGTPLEMIIYLDDESKAVYGLLASFLKVTDSTQAQLRATSGPTKEEAIILNGCSIDPYIFGNFETPDGGDSVSAKFRAFKFPESNYVMFVGTVNVCLDQCIGVPCGGDIVAFGRRRRRSVPAELPKDPNKVFEIEMTTYLQIGYPPAATVDARKRREKGDSTDSETLISSASVSDSYSPSKLTASEQKLPTSSKLAANSFSSASNNSFLFLFLSLFSVIFAAKFFVF